MRNRCEQVNFKGARGPGFRCHSPGAWDTIRAVGRAQRCRGAFGPADRPSRQHLRELSKKGEMAMGDTGKKDKGKKEVQKKALLTPKEKRKLKNEKKAK
jgi:hypothetical protein